MPIYSQTGGAIMSKMMTEDDLKTATREELCEEIWRLWEGNFYMEQYIIRQAKRGDEAYTLRKVTMLIDELMTGIDIARVYGRKPHGKVT